MSSTVRRPWFLLALVPQLVSLACGGGTYDGDGAVVDVGGSSGAARPDGPKPTSTKDELSYRTDEDTPVELELPFTDPGDGPLVYRASAPAHGSVQFANGKVFYVPAENYFGDDAFSLIAANANGTAEVAVKVQVAPINDAPLVAGDSYTVKRGESVEITLRALDIEGQPLTFEITRAPRQGTLSGDGPVVIYTPEPSYRGNDSFKFRVSDGELNSREATISLRVTGTVVCGDGIVEGSEQCDDGNEVDTDGCRNDCTLPVCGDGIVDAGEQCDDGNEVDGDGCSATCAVEP